MIYFVLVDFFSLSMYFGVAKVTAKIVQMSEMKKKYAVFFFISECRLSYEERDLYNVENKSEKYIIWKLINK